MRQMKLGDKILIGVLIILSIFSFWYIQNINKNINSQYVSVQVDGREIKQIDFATSDRVIHETIQTEYGRNVLEIGRDYVKVIEADCPDQLDVLQGAIDSPGQLIVCLPNRLIIEVRGEKQAMQQDGPVIDDTVR